jgi:hypothetical protein
MYEDIYIAFLYFDTDTELNSKLETLYDLFHLKKEDIHLHGYTYSKHIDLNTQKQRNRFQLLKSLYNQTLNNYTYIWIIDKDIEFVNIIIYV